MADIFVSYSRPDRPLVEKLAEELRRRGLSVWDDTQIRPGEDWAVAIQTALEAAKRVVVLWTDTAAESRYVRYEAQLASKLKKLTIAMFGDAEPPSLLSQSQYIKATGPDPVDELATMIAATFQEAGWNAEPSARSPEISDAPTNRGFAFLSYAEEDSAFADELRRFLTGEKFLYWEYSSGERDIEKLLYLELEAKIRESDVVISIVSPDWKHSVWAAREYFFAKEIGRPVFIVESRSTEPTLAIAGEHRITIWGERRSLGFELLSRELKRRGL